MGWKISMIIIENSDNFQDERSILRAIQKKDFQFHGETTFEECIYPRDKLISIGNYRENIIISDD